MGNGGDGARPSGTSVREGRRDPAGERAPLGLQTPRLQQGEGEAGGQALENSSTAAVACRCHSLVEPSRSSGRRAPAAKEPRRAGKFSAHETQYAAGHGRPEPETTKAKGPAPASTAMSCSSNPRLAPVAPRISFQGAHDAWAATKSMRGNKNNVFFHAPFCVRPSGEARALGGVPGTRTHAPLGGGVGRH